MKTFYTAAKLGSFTKAAESLFFTQPAVSLQIKDLEQEYGSQLFERIGKKLRLTQAGEALLPLAEKMLSVYMESHDAVNGTRDSASGRIRTGATNYTGIHVLPELIAGYLKKFPGNKVSIHLEYASKIQTMLMSNEIDIGIVGSNQYRILEESLLETELYRDAVTAVVGPEHPWCSRTEISCDELAGEPMILPIKASLTRQYIERRFSKKKIQLNIAYEIENIFMIKKMVEHNLGVTLLNSSEVRRECEAGWLCSIPVKDLEIQRRIIMLYHRDKPLSAALTQMIDFLTETRESYQKRLIGSQFCRKS